MSEAEAEASEAEAVAEFQGDTPSISTAVKTLLSLVLAEGKASGEATASPQLVPAAKALVASISACEVPARADASVRYDVARRLREKVLQHGGTMCSLFGRRYLETTGVLAEARARAGAASASLATDIELLATRLQASLAGGPDADLVWAEDWRAALAERQRARAAEAEARVTRMESSDEDLRRLRNADAVFRADADRSAQARASGVTLTELASAEAENDQTTEEHE